MTIDFPSAAVTAADQLEQMSLYIKQLADRLRNDPTSAADIVKGVNYSVAELQVGPLSELKNAVRSQRNMVQQAHRLQLAADIADSVQVDLPSFMRRLS